MWPYWDNLESWKRDNRAMATGGSMSGVNEGLSSDFFARMYPRLAPMSDEQYRNSPKRARDEAHPWQERWHGF